MDDVTQTSRLCLRRCRSATVEKRPGRDGPGESFALCSSSNKPESTFQGRSGDRSFEQHSSPAVFHQGLAMLAGGPPNEDLEKLLCNKRNSCRDTIALARR